MINFVRRKYFTWLWRRRNPHNFTFFVGVPQNVNHYDAISVGKGTYGPIYAPWSGNPDESLSIGSYCSIGTGTKFIMGSEHQLDILSTYPWRVKASKESWEATTKGPIVIEDDVWIGEDALVLSGVHIGRGAVIAARALVTKNVPPFAIVAGVPARVVRFRFAKDICQRIMRLPTALLPYLQSNYPSLLYSKMSEETLCQIEQIFIASQNDILRYK